MQLAGAPLDVYFDDLVIDGQEERFDVDPGWVGSGNQIEFTERVLRPYHDFGYSPTANAGGEAGEIGGIVFRDEAPAYYGADVGSLSLDTPLFASGKIAFCRAGSDSAVCLGWFNAQGKKNKQTPEHQQRQSDYLAVLVEGPSRVGHYFRPCYSTATGNGAAPLEDPATGKPRPIIKPDRQHHTWTLAYDPKLDNGRGRITLSLDGDSHSLTLKDGERRQGRILIASDCSTCRRADITSKSISTTSATPQQSPPVVDVPAVSVENCNHHERLRQPTARSRPKKGNAGSGGA